MRERKLHWYEERLDMLQAETESMLKFDPYAEQLLLDDGRACWMVRIAVPAPSAPAGRREWRFLIVYDESHHSPSVTTLCYPVSPGEAEMLEMLRRAGKEPAGIPHTMRDGDGHIFLSSWPCGQEGSPDGIHSAVDELRLSIRWALCFELSLVDDGMWRDFSGM